MESGSYFAGALRVTGLACLLALASGSNGRAQSFFNNWSRCTELRGQPERRINYCTRLLNNGGGPNSEIAVLTVLGGIYRDQHQYAKALDAYSHALGYEALGVSDTHSSTNAPGSTISIPTASALVTALEGRAEIYALTAQPAAALDDTAHIFRLEPDTATSYAIRCRIRAIMKTDLDKALADCGEATKRDAKNTEALGASALLQYQLGHLPDATENLDRALDVSPKLAGALYLRGVIELHSGKSAEGNADIAAAITQDPLVAAGFSDLGIGP